MKWDILGLTTLDRMALTVKLIKERHGVDIKIEEIDVNDPSIYKLLNDGHTVGIFQFDGTAAAYIPRVQPVNVSEISALTSILRPGPMSMGMVELYTDAKFEGKKFEYKLKDQKLLNKVWDICSNAYGLLIYQEHVIKCFSEIAGFDEIAADTARRVVGKFLPVMVEISYLNWGKSVKA